LGLTLSCYVSDNASVRLRQATSDPSRKPPTLLLLNLSPTRLAPTRLAFRGIMICRDSIPVGRFFSDVISTVFDRAVYAGCELQRQSFVRDTIRQEEVSTVRVGRRSGSSGRELLTSMASGLVTGVGTSPIPTGRCQLYVLSKTRDLAFTTSKVPAAQHSHLPHHGYCATTASPSSARPTRLAVRARFVSSLEARKLLLSMSSKVVHYISPFHTFSTLHPVNID